MGLRVLLDPEGSGPGLCRLLRERSVCISTHLTASTPTQHQSHLGGQVETSNVNWSLRVTLDAPNVHLEQKRSSATGTQLVHTHLPPAVLLPHRTAEAPPHRDCRLRLQVLRAHVFQLQLVGQSQQLDVCGGQAGVVPRPPGHLRHCKHNNRLSALAPEPQSH